VATLRHAAIPLRAVTRRPTVHRRRVVTLLPILPGAVALIAVVVAHMVAAVVAAHTVAAIAE